MDCLKKPQDKCLVPGIKVFSICEILGPEKFTWMAHFNDVFGNFAVKKEHFKVFLIVYVL